MNIALFGDTHDAHDRISVPEADILIFADDMSNCRAEADDPAFNRFLGQLPHPYKIVIAGNLGHYLS